jgi:RNA polymerase sigma-70 factor, ECF subfamily
MQSPYEVQLVTRAQRGDERAFEDLFKEHRGWVFSLCRRMTRDPAQAEDLTQEAFLQLFRRIATFRGESSFSTWMHRLVVNVVLMNLRKKKPAGAALEGAPSGREEAPPREYGAEDARLQGVIDRITIIRALERLPEDYRAAILLHDVEGYKHAEIVRLRSHSVGTSKSQLHRARLMLRRFLGESENARLSAPAA